MELTSFLLFGPHTRRRHPPLAAHTHLFVLSLAAPHRRYLPAVMHSPHAARRTSATLTADIHRTKYIYIVGCSFNFVQIIRNNLQILHLWLFRSKMTPHLTCSICLSAHCISQRHNSSDSTRLPG